MSINKSLLPSTDISNHLDTETGEILPAAYRTGIPRQYRFNASTGALNLNGETPVTKAGKGFKILPIGLRVFRDNLFEFGRKTWAEFFFLNAKNQVSSLMFHGYSVENLVALETEMFYEDLSIGKVVLSVEPKEKTSKVVDSNGKNPKYFICDFSFEEASEDLITAQESAIEGLLIYRKDTWSLDSEIQMVYKLDSDKIRAEMLNGVEVIKELAATAE